MAGQTTNYLFDYPTSTDYVKDGATAIQTLATDVDTTLFTALGGAYPGLRLIKKQTIGTSVTSVNVTGAFSAAYENYKIVISGGVGAGADYGYIKLGASSTGYFGGFTGIVYTSAAASNATNNNASSQGYTWYGDTNALVANIDLLAPFLAKYTNFQCNYGAASQSISGAGVHRVATSYTDFTVGMNGGGAFTGGTIYVYGYGAS
jgi:hypothetical protein